MRSVTVELWTEETPTTQSHFRTEQGVFHQWGLELFEETEGPSFNFTVGIVELLDGTVHTISPIRIKFNAPETLENQSEED